MSKIRYIVVATLLVLSACGGESGPTLDATVATPTPAPPAADTEAPEALAADLDEPPVVTPEPTVTDEQRIERAVDLLAEADSYAFAVTVSINTLGESVETELQGWVQGDDRELTLSAESGEVVTRVIAGVATITRDGQTVDVPLSQASDAPGLDVLRGLNNVVEGADGALSSELLASELTELGFEVNGSANVTVTLTAEGELASYTLEAADGAWAVVTQFSDVGAEFSTE